MTFRSKKDKTPHYCDRKYGEAVADRFFYMKDFWPLRRLPFWSLARGVFNSLLLPQDKTFMCNGTAELYPVWCKYPESDIVTLVKEQLFWEIPGMPEAKREFLLRVFSVNSGLIVDTAAMKRLVRKYTDADVGVCNPFCVNSFLENKPSLEKKNIIFVGAYSANKGYPRLIDAFRLLSERDKGWNLYMLGSCAEAIKEKVSGMHVPGFVPDIGPYLSGCSIYVHPAYFESFGITVLEAMSAGLIPVVTAQTGASEVLVKNGLSGLVAKDNRPETLLRKIEKIDSWKIKKKRSVSEKCKDIVRKDYLERAGVEKFRLVFNSLLGR